MPVAIVTINIEEGRPTLEEARIRLKSALAECRNRKALAAKVIHGYGSR
jgi:DNA-nicking Smr family endonuclease